MRVIHFTVGACDPLWGRGVSGVDFMPLLEGGADTMVGCLHLGASAFFDDDGIENPRAFLIVAGTATLMDPCRIDLSGGVGIVMDCGEHVRLESREGAIILLVESADLHATEHAISSPARISGQRWLGE